MKPDAPVTTITSDKPLDIPRVDVPVARDVVLRAAANDFVESICPERSSPRPLYPNIRHRELFPGWYGREGHNSCIGKIDNRALFRQDVLAPATGKPHRLRSFDKIVQLVRLNRNAGVGARPTPRYCEMLLQQRRSERNRAETC